ncbi:hypothetical protein ACFP3Q_01450 [Nocardioides sp. GCM10027113]|uniref:hypothetical protein n=1 Tax=unclassified Nocardioides TaxID=2615069 RepID=UPI0036124DA1
MYARSITIQGDVDRLEDGIAYVRDEVLPEMPERPGWVGLSMLVDRVTGRCIVTSSWRTAGDMRASDLHLAPLRHRGARLLGGMPLVEEWEVAVMHRAHRVEDGACCRVAWLRTDHARVDSGIAVYRASLMPEMESLPGFVNASLLVNRGLARACSTATYDTWDAMEASRDRAWALREARAREVGVDVLDVAEMELVLAHLRVPELV